MTPKQLGFDQKTPGVLRLPDGLDAMNNFWFQSSDIEKLVVSKGVRGLGMFQFSDCEQLREVVFEPDSRLEYIGNHCFAHSGLRQIVIPKNVLFIDCSAFSRCRDLSSLRFEDGSRITCIGPNAFCDTGLTPWNVRYPSTLVTDGSEWGDFFADERPLTVQQYLMA